MDSLKFVAKLLALLYQQVADPIYEANGELISCPSLLDLHGGLAVHAWGAEEGAAGVAHRATL
jgi:hypothetical protein